jgi:hypothetical protein
MKRIGLNPFTPKDLGVYLIIWVLHISPASSSIAGRNESSRSTIAGGGLSSKSGTVGIVDLRDFAIFAQYWLETDCNAANNWCGGADLDHLNDRDYDGYTSDVDCDDLDPNVFPGAPEVRDGKDNDCDPDGKADEGLIAPGDIIITEILYDSSEVPDSRFEWFEMYNPTDTPVNMRGWLLRDQPGSTQEITVVNNDVIVPAKGLAVFCRTLPAMFNGGVVCDYEYGYLNLENTADELILDFDGVIVDEVWYDENAGWPRAAYGSLNLDPDAFGLDNNDPSNWCKHPAGYEIPNGDEGTPGAPNVECW